ncbi:MAG: hypothetical protein ACREYC_24925 [Gammaproteobacteria bacterium]
MHAQLRGEGADGPVLGVIEAQDLRFERARDQDRVPSSTPHAAEACKRRQLALAETAAGIEDLVFDRPIWKKKCRLQDTP